MTGYEHQWRPWAALGLAAVCAGCGGGGSSDTSGGGTTPPAGGDVVVPTTIRSVAASAGSLLTASNYVQFAGPLARAVLSSTGDSLVGTTLGNGNVGAASAVRAQAESTTTRGDARVQPLSTATSTENCTNGGTLTVTADDADSNDVLSVGDMLTLAASNCVVSLGETPTDGGFTLTVKAIDLDSSNNATGLDATGTLQSFSVGSDAVLAGNFELWAKQASSTQKQLRLSYADVSSVFNTETVQYDFDIDVGVTTSATTYAMNGALWVSGQAYKLVQQTSFSVADTDAPTAGVVTLQDTTGATLQLTARTGGLVDFAFYPAGSTTPSATLTDQTWDSYRNAP